MFNERGVMTRVVTTKIVRKFYASYVSNLRTSRDSLARTTKKEPVTYVLVGDFMIDISEITLHQFLYGPINDTIWAPMTLEFN